jgi:hypothetical protein
MLTVNLSSIMISKYQCSNLPMPSNYAYQSMRSCYVNSHTSGRQIEIDIQSRL